MQIKLQQGVVTKITTGWVYTWKWLTTTLLLCSAFLEMQPEPWPAASTTPGHGRFGEQQQGQTHTTVLWRRVPSGLFKAKYHPFCISTDTLSAPVLGYQNQLLQSKLFIWLAFYGIFMSFPGAVDLISSQSNGTSASLSGLSLGEAALQKCVHASPTETPFFMSFASEEVIIVLK